MFLSDLAIKRPVVTVVTLLALLVFGMFALWALKVDEFRLGIDCDSASYQARFVRLARPAQIAGAGPPIDEGCS